MKSEGNYKDHLYALILAGGGGTRLWPKSRNETPKQFLQLFGKETLTQITVNRFLKILPWERIYIVTATEEYRKEIKKELPDMPNKNIIVEPMRRNTAAAMGIGAIYIYRQDPNAVILTESADRLATPVNVYLKTLLASAEIAFTDNVLVAVGVEPRYPHTGLGHIKRGKKVAVVQKKTFYKADKFVEKPRLELAKKYTESGNYYWNAGQFVWRASSYLETIAKTAPEISRGLTKINNAIGSATEQSVIKNVYQELPDISVDYAVAEKAKNMVVIGGDFFWTDIGDWKEVWSNSNKDAEGNVILHEAKDKVDLINIGSSDSIVHTNGRLVALVDVDNLVVIDMPDALLVSSKSKAQDVKKVVEKLKADKRTELL